MRVWQAKEADIPAIAAVHVAAWKSGYRGIMADDFLDRLTIARRDTQWRRYLAMADRRLLICKEQGEVTGFAACGPSRDGDEDPALVGELYAINVAPDYWRRGCGQALVKRIIRELTRAKFALVTLWVLDANERARRFYEGAGFALDAGGRRMVQVSGMRLPEVRYRKNLVKN
jgi:ribosomal protein S18 acetylase RimI-like enzyme